MARRFGPEETRVLADEGMVSAESMRYQRMADDLCARRKPNEALPYIHKAMEDPNNIDIFITFAFLQPNLNESLSVLERGKRLGQLSLRSKYGPSAFYESGPLVGTFMHNLDTRPYIRLLQAFVRIQVEAKKYSAAIDTIVEMFRLNPMDPMGQHKWLGTLLCRTRRYADALYFAQVFMDICVKRMDLRDLPPGGGTHFLPPRRNLYTPDEQEKLTSYESTILYTAAFATFKMSGDCPESRMYLKLAAEANPRVLVKILGRIERPDSLKSVPRAHNSPEDAHDYLWLSQDLWMQNDVWKWVNDNPDAKKTALQFCGRPECGKRESAVVQFKECGGCRTILYCDPACQKLDWARHKPDCSLQQEMKNIHRAVNKGKPIPANSKIPVLASDFTEHGIIMYDPSPVKMTEEQEQESAAKKKKKNKKKKKKKSKAQQNESQPEDNTGEDEDGDAALELEEGMTKTTLA